MSTSLMYRREIDGLRAVAVVPVILFHAGFGVFSGGYVGVDVFFVISGYLITTILINELAQGNFSIAGFYERRARRILPALFIVMLACLPFAYMWMLPSQLKDFSGSIFAVVISLSNLFFLTKVGYFAPSAELQPLLHTWSLAIEEQYYFIFPLFLLIINRLKLSIVGFIVFGLVIISFIFSEWAWREDAERSFFFTISRFWEIGVGSLCAFLTISKAPRSNNLLSTVGLAMIVFSIFAYDANIPFPSVYALVPVIGTALIILFAAQGTWVARLLSMRVFVGIGLISFSAYLWHQPLFAFARLRSLTEPSEYLMAALAVAAVLLAWATWRFVEQPFRKSKNSLIGTRRGVFLVSGTIGALFISIGLSGHFGNGFEGRLKYISNSMVTQGSVKEALNQWEMSGYTQPINWTTDPLTGLKIFRGTGNRVVSLIGDSHAVQYRNAFDTFYGKPVLDDNTPSLIVVNDTNFPPAISSIPLRRLGKNGIVVLSYFWSYRYRSSSVNEFIRCCGNGQNGVVGSTRPTASDTEMDEYDRELSKFVSQVISHGMKVVFVLDNPFGEELNAQSLIEKNGFEVTAVRPFSGVSRSIALERTEPVRSRLLNIASKYEVEVIDPFDFLCTDGFCPAFGSDGRMLYKDYDHISEYTSGNRTSYIWSVLHK